MSSAGVIAVFVAALLTTASSAFAVKAGPVVVTVTESEELARQDWPVTFGVPWPRAALRDGGRVAVTTEKGTSLPVQTRVLSRWSDDSVRWLLIDTQITLGAGQTVRLRVIPQGGKQSGKAARLSVKEDSDAIQIDSGVLSAVIPKARFAIAENVRAAGSTFPGSIGSSIERDGETVRARPPRQVTVRESGPVRVRIEMVGDYGNGFDYLVRVDAFAGKPFLRVLHTFINRDADELARVKRIAIDWPLELAPETAYAAGAGNDGVHAGDLRKAPVRLAQPDNVHSVVNGEERPGTLAGWIALQPTKRGTVLGVAARWFWQEYPKGFEVRPTQLTYNLWDPSGGDATVGMGAAKTHEFVLFAGEKQLADPRWVTAVARPLTASVDPAWVARSGALPQSIATSPVTSGFIQSLGAGFDRYIERNRTERWDDRGQETCNGFFGERPRTGAYGMWNWGDWNFPTYHDDTKGCDAWGNLEYDTTQVLALAFAASGRADIHEAMVVAARHFMDVDTIHYQKEHPEWIGMNHPKNPLHFSFKLGGIDLGHTWAEGLVSYYYLTGDERGLAAARGIADYLVRRVSGRIFLANPRQLGWPQVALIAAYEATAEQEYLQAARAYAARAIEVYGPGEIDHWKQGILADALAYTHGATGDQKIEAWLREYGKKVRNRSRADPRFLPALAYVARLDGDVNLRERILDRVKSIDLGGWGKPFTINGRIGFRIYSILADMPVTRLTRGKEAKRTASSVKARRDL